MSSDRVFRFNIPHVTSNTLRAAGVYLAGAFYSAGFYIMLDSALFSKLHNASKVHVTFADWIPLILSSLGMIVVNSVDKSRLISDSSFSFGGGSTAEWQAKVVLFLGFALLAGGIAGSIVILVIRYVIHHYTMPTVGMGVENVVANTCVIVSGIALWLAQNLEDEYSYSLQL